MLIKGVHERFCMTNIAYSIAPIHPRNYQLGNQVLVERVIQILHHAIHGIHANNYSTIPVLANQFPSSKLKYDIVLAISRREGFIFTSKQQTPACTEFVLIGLHENRQVTLINLFLNADPNVLDCVMQLPRRAS